MLKRTFFVSIAFICMEICTGLLLQNVPVPDQTANLQGFIHSANVSIQALTSRVDRLEKDSNEILHNQIHALNSSMNALKASNKQLEQKMMAAPVAFLAELGKSITDPSKDSPLIFDAVHLNDGGVYSGIHGVFTAPVSGLYHFTLELTRTPTNGAAYIRLMLSSTIVGYVYLEGNPIYHKKRSATTTLHLTKGDDVWVKVTGVTTPVTVLGCCYHSIFSGFLIKAD